MPPTERAPACDTCGGMLRNVKPVKTPDRKRWFLSANRECLSVAQAARRAGLHLATVYRWMADPDFAATMQVAADEFFPRVRAVEVEAQWWQPRDRARRPMRCSYPALARVAKRRR
jgi:hypothetical protein